MTMRREPGISAWAAPLVAWLSAMSWSPVMIRVGTFSPGILGRSDGQPLIGSRIWWPRSCGLAFRSASALALASGWPGAITQPDFSALATTASILPMIIGAIMRLTCLPKLGLGWKPLIDAPETTRRSTCSGCRMA